MKIVARDVSEAFRDPRRSVGVSALEAMFVGPALVAQLQIDQAAQRRAAPEAPVLQGGSGAWSSNPTPALSWNTPLDDGSGPVSYKLRINGVAEDLPNVNRYEKTLQSGRYNAEVAAVDAMGRQSGWSNTVSLAVDSEPPAAVGDFRSSTHPNPDEWYKSNTPSFEWSEPPDVSGLEGYYYYIDQNPSTVPGSQYWFTAQPRVTVAGTEGLQSGGWYIHVVGVDKAGNNSAPVHFPFQIDTEAPSTLLLDPEANPAILDAYDEHSGVQITRYSLARGAAKTERAGTLRHGDFDWTVGEVIPLPEKGDYTIYFYSEDALGNREPVRMEVVYSEGMAKDEDSSKVQAGGGYGNVAPYFRHLATPKKKSSGKTLSAIEIRRMKIRLPLLKKRYVKICTTGSRTTCSVLKKWILEIESLLKNLPPALKVD